MTNNEMAIWWSSLPVAEKERIARKGQMKGSADGKVDEALCHYPGCTLWWNALPPERKETIYDHCVNRHGLEIKEWDDANPYGD